VFKGEGLPGVDDALGEAASKVMLRILAHLRGDVPAFSVLFIGVKYRPLVCCLLELNAGL